MSRNAMKQSLCTPPWLLVESFHIVSRMRLGMHGFGDLTVTNKTKQLHLTLEGLATV